MQRNDDKKPPQGRAGKRLAEPSTTRRTQQVGVVEDRTGSGLTTHREIFTVSDRHGAGSLQSRSIIDMPDVEQGHYAKKIVVDPQLMTFSNVDYSQSQSLAVKQAVETANHQVSSAINDMVKVREQNLQEVNAFAENARLSKQHHSIETIKDFKLNVDLTDCRSNVYVDFDNQGTRSTLHTVLDNWPQKNNNVAIAMKINSPADAEDAQILCEVLQSCGPKLKLDIVQPSAHHTQGIVALAKEFMKPENRQLVSQLLTSREPSRNFADQIEMALHMGQGDLFAYVGSRLYGDLQKIHSVGLPSLSSGVTSPSPSQVSTELNSPQSSAPASELSSRSSTPSSVVPPISGFNSAKIAVGLGGNLAAATVMLQLAQQTKKDALLSHSSDVTPSQSPSLSPVSARPPLQPTRPSYAAGTKSATMRSVDQSLESSRRLVDKIENREKDLQHGGGTRRKP